MGNGQKDFRQGGQMPAPLSKAGGLRWLLVLGAIILAGAASYVLWPAPAPAPAPAASPDAAQAPPASTPASAPAAPAKTFGDVGQGRLVGRWLRPDGGYLLEIRSAAADGRLEAGYFNPNPIHVARAEWQPKDGRLAVYVELRDVNYPGSIYRLWYDAGQDIFAGSYFQALEQQWFEVSFERQ